MIWSGADPTFESEVLSRQVVRGPKRHPKESDLRKVASRVKYAGLAAAAVAIVVSGASDLWVDPHQGEERVSQAPPQPAQSGVFDLNGLMSKTWNSAVELLRARGDDPQEALQSAGRVLDVWKERPCDEHALNLSDDGLPIDEV